MRDRPGHWLQINEQTTLPALFQQRVARTPDALAYRFYAASSGRWKTLTWRQAAQRVAAWRALLQSAGVKPGDRVAIMLRNSPEWLCLDQAVLSLGAITVGLFCTDTPGNNAAIIDHSGACVLVAVKQQWVADILAQSRCSQLQQAFVFADAAAATDGRVSDAETALQRDAVTTEQPATAPADDVASLVYALGASRQPRASRMSHRNLVWCAQAMADALPVVAEEHCVSYLPLSYSYERVADAYRAMLTGATLTFCRHSRFLNVTLAKARPTTLFAVPRMYERFDQELRRRLARRPVIVRRIVGFTIRVGNSVFDHEQGRGRRRLAHLLWPLLRATAARYCLRPFGGNLAYAVSAGAALPHPVARTLIGLGLPVLQGYGLSEAGPMVSMNRAHDNHPDSVGHVLDGVETRVGPDGELLVRSSGVMAGYWQDDQATARVIDAGGWLHTGDKASRLDKSHLFLTGRIKEVIALTTGGKALPGPLEAVLREDNLLTGVVVVGEARPALAAIVNCRPEVLAPVMHELQLNADSAKNLSSVRLENYFLQRFAALLTQFPQHSQIRHVAVTTEPWTRDNKLLDAAGKPRRRAVARHYHRDVARLFGRRADSEKTDVSQNTNLG